MLNAPVSTPLINAKAPGRNALLHQWQFGHHKRIDRKKGSASPPIPASPIHPANAQRASPRWECQSLPPSTSETALVDLPARQLGQKTSKPIITAAIATNGVATRIPAIKVISGIESSAKPNPLIWRMTEESNKARATGKISKSE